MLKRRVVLLLCFNDGVLFRTKRFVPDYRYTQRLVGNRNADEVVVLDVTPPGQGDRRNFYRALEAYAQECFSPITAGGGIRTLDEVGLLMREFSADKVVIGVKPLQEDLRLARDIVHKFGAQALTVAFNHREAPDFYGLRGERSKIWIDYDRHAKDDAIHCGELLLNSIPRDGSLQGYDLETIRRAASVQSESDIPLPIMVAGGCGTWQHMADAFDAGADAACTSVIHHFTETSLKACKDWLVEHRQPVRSAA